MFVHLLGQDVDQLIHKHVAAMCIQKKWLSILNIHDGLIDTALQIEVLYDEHSRAMLMTNHNAKILKFVARRLPYLTRIEDIIQVWNKVILLPIRSGILLAMRQNILQRDTVTWWMTDQVIQEIFKYYKILSSFCRQRIGKRLNRISKLYLHPFFSLSAH